MTQHPADVVHIFSTYCRIYNEEISEFLENPFDLRKARLMIEGPNPAYGRMVSGYLLEWYYGSPNKLHTPEGMYTFFGGDCVSPPQALLEKIDNRLCEELGLVLAHKMVYRTGPCGGQVGPFYKVVGTKDFVVPEASSPFLDGLEPDRSTMMSMLYEKVSQRLKLNS